MIPGTLAVLIFMLTLPPLFAACTPQRETVKSDVGSWDPETGLGNHRAVVRVEVPPAAKAAPKAEGAACVKAGGGHHARRAISRPGPYPLAAPRLRSWKKSRHRYRCRFGRTDPQRHASGK